jgi:hypothetical protein
MNKRPLPLAYFVLTIAAAILFLSLALPGDEKKSTRTEPATDHLSLVRANQVTGKLNPADYLKALQQVERQEELKAGQAFDFDWDLLGPNNLGGKTRAILFYNKDTMIAGSVMGGLFRSDNAGAKWYKIAGENGNMNVSCITQNGSGDIYVGTGDNFTRKDSTVLTNWGYSTGFMGQGIFKSTDGLTFDLLPVTKPFLNGNDEMEWGFIYELAAHPSNGELYAATNTGLKYSSDGGNTWRFAKASDTLELAMDARDVKMAASGLVIAEVNKLCYISENGNPDNFILRSGDSTYNLPRTGIGRMEFAIAPSNNDIIYALVVNPDGGMLNVYRSENKGETWTIVGPGGSSNFNVFYNGINYTYGTGLTAATIEVFPDDPYHLLVGGVTLWEGRKILEDGFYEWIVRSASTADWLSPAFVWLGHHTYKFVPGSSSSFFIGSNGGITKADITGNFFAYQFMNKDFIGSQFYTVSPTMEKKNVVGGAQGLGTIYINGAANPADDKRGADIWTTQGNVPDGKTGGYCAWSTIYPSAVIYSRFPHPPLNDILETFVRRNEFSGGPDWSANMFDGDFNSIPTSFLTPFLLWENFEDYNTKDSVGKKITREYPAGSTVWVESNNGNRPFKYVTPVALQKGDSIAVPDIISARFFIGGRDQVLMTKHIIQFDRSPEWYVISDKAHNGVADFPQCMAYSSDANHLFVGTDKGKLYRVSNIKYAYNEETADVSSPYSVISTKRIPVYLPGTTTENTQVITSVAVDPNDDSKVIITMGNYGNEHYVYYSDNALDENPVFRSVQGNPDTDGLPQVPAYSSLIEMDPDNNLVFVGTEFGIYVSNNIEASNPTWVKENKNIGGVPVFMLKQQTIRKENDTIMFINIDTTYVIHYGTNNYGVIYGATYGRGLIALDEFQKPVGIFDPAKPVANNSFSVYPNPAADKITVAFEMPATGKVDISVFDLQGKLVKQVDLGVRPEGRHDAILNCNSLAKGTYVVRLTLGNRHSSVKFVIQ